MFCCRCQNDLEDCVCPDLADRMRRASEAGTHVVSRWCGKCDQHYAVCRCEEPTWMLRADGELSALPTPGDET